jgi:hypothetical protein
MEAKSVITKAVKATKKPRVNLLKKILDDKKRCIEYMKEHDSLEGFEYKFSIKRVYSSILT